MELCSYIAPARVEVQLYEAHCLEHKRAWTSYHYHSSGLVPS